MPGWPVCLYLIDWERVKGGQGEVGRGWLLGHWALLGPRRNIWVGAAA